METTCTMCGRDALVDEHGRCERCLTDAVRRAVILDDFEGVMEEAFQRGLTRSALRGAFELALSNLTGALPGDCVVRERRARQGAVVWDVRPSSSWSDEPPVKSNLRRLRRFDGYTLEELAAELGEDVSTVALWERGAPIPDETLGYLSEMFAMSTDYIAG